MKHSEEIKTLVNLWHETQMGHYKTCQEKSAELADIMWNLYNEIHNINEE